MNYIIGIDGGGTKSFLRACDLDNNVLYEGLGGGTNLCSASYDQVLKNLQELLKNCILAIDDEYNLVGVCIGSAGVTSKEIEDKLEKIIKDICGNVKVIVKNDAHIALYANLSDKNGISITAGTGSICYGKKVDSEIIRVGGWGHIFGDEGSGYKIAVDALNLVAKMSDKRIEETSIKQAFFENFKVATINELTDIVYNSLKEKKQIAKLSIIVYNCANNGDNIAIGILKNAAEDLFHMVKAAIEVVDFNNEKFLIVLNGSILLKNSIVKNHFLRLVSENYKNAVIEDAVLDAAWGAIHLIKNASL